MRAFADSSGTKWLISIEPAANKRVIAMCGLDLFGVGMGDVLRRLMDEPATVLDVIYAACKPQADAAGVSIDDFYRLAAPEIDAAQDALLEAIVDFFPRRTREILRTALRKSGEAMDAATPDVMAAIEARSAEAIAKLKRDLLSESGG